MYKEFFESFILVFVAEMGDKTQLMLMTLADKYSVIQVLSGILAGVLLNHGLAVYVGSFISDMTNEYLLQLLVFQDFLHYFI
jgi:putative Ca2+/H+ antiporter (TMEM165/GDT1 family)